MSFFMLSPTATIHERLDGEIQLGTNPQNAVIVHGLTRENLHTINGHHDVAQIAGLTGAPESQLWELIKTLQRAGLVIERNEHVELPYLGPHERRCLLREAPPRHITKRLETVIHLHGLNRLGVLIGSLLREAGFPHLRFVDDRLVTTNDVQVWGFSRVDIGQRRDRTLALMHEAVTRGALHKQIHPRVTVPAELHIVVSDQQADWPILNPFLVDEFSSAGINYLVVAYADLQSFITPVFNADTQGCLRCYFQTLVDRDPSWPLIFENIIHQAVSDRAPIGLLIDTAVAVVQRIAEFLSIESPADLLVLNWPTRETSVEPWIAHPACGCGWDRML